MLSHLPLARPAPDARRFIKILLGRTEERRAPLVEYLVDDSVMRPIVMELLGRRWVEDLGNRQSQSAYLDNFVAFWRHLGYDCVRYEKGLIFPERQILAADTAPGVWKQRAWADEHQGSIRSWEEFERYPWPRVEDFDFFPFEYLNGHLPEGMGLLTCHAGGIFEHLSWIMSLEGLCLSLHDNPGLVQAVADRIGSLLSGFYEHLLGLDRLAAIFTGDDMGFRSSTLISPNDLRRYVLPWHKKFAAMAHAKRIPYFLHSCGNIEAVMEDLISDIEIDGKHSFEDTIMTAEDFQQRYGRRIAVLGGLDVHTLTVGSPDEVRRRTRALIEECGAKGRFAVGSGNSIPSYVPVANYLAMVDEALD